MIVRFVGEVVLRETIDVLQMGLLLELVIANTLKVEIHHRAVLVAKFIHDIVIFLLLFVDKDRLQGSLWLLLEHFDYVLWLKLMRALWLHCVLEGSYGLKAQACSLCRYCLKPLLAISFEIELIVQGRYLGS